MNRGPKIIIGLLSLILSGVWCVLAPITGPTLPVGVGGVLVGAALAGVIGLGCVGTWGRPFITRIVAGFLSFAMIAAFVRLAFNGQLTSKPSISLASIALVIGLIEGEFALTGAYGGLPVFRAHFLSKVPNPKVIHHHELLGEMQFFEDDESWHGMLNGFAISVAYKNQSEPDLSLIEYAISLAQDREWLEGEFRRASDEFVVEYPEYKGEVGDLLIGAINVYKYKGINMAMVDLEGGHEYRAWRIEFTERNCDGLGFDS